MLALTRKTGYGLIAMAHLASSGDQPTSARAIAQACEVPQSLLMNVLKELSAAGFVESTRGAHGGYRLARSPQSISVADLVAALEGPVRQSQCRTDQTGVDQECTCSVMARCPNIDPVHRVQRRLYDLLRKVTLAEIARPESVLEADSAPPGDQRPPIRTTDDGFAFGVRIAPEANPT
jgi:Rrf2 family protein